MSQEEMMKTENGRTCDKVFPDSTRCNQPAVARIVPGARDQGDPGAWDACERHTDDAKQSRWWCRLMGLSAPRIIPSAGKEETR